MLKIKLKDGTLLPIPQAVEAAGGPAIEQYVAERATPTAAAPAAAAVSRPRGRATQSKE